MIIIIKTWSIPKNAKNTLAQLPPQKKGFFQTISLKQFLKKEEKT